MTVSWLLGRLVCQSGIISKKGREDTTLRSYIGGLFIFEPPLGGGSQGSRGCIIVFIFLIIV